MEAHKYYKNCLDDHDYPIQCMLASLMKKSYMEADTLYR